MPGRERMKGEQFQTSLWDNEEKIMRDILVYDIFL